MHMTDPHRDDDDDDDEEEEEEQDQYEDVWEGTPNCSED